jgi:ABC-type nitrate/sulfonate/bicarbonate transport system substrate-binding protein
MMRLLEKLMLAAAAAAAGIASATQPLEVIIFPGATTWPLWVAQEKGFFAANGLDVNLTVTPNSVELMRSLLAGKYQLAHAAFDNAVAYQEGQGEVELPSSPDFCAFMGGQIGGMRLMVQPEIRAFADLRGKTLAVDAATTGYAFLLRKMLQAGGLSEGDYTFERVGGTTARVEALMQGKTAGTIVTSPLDILPESKGYRRLADGDSVGPYQATLGLVRRSWAREHETIVVGYIHAYVTALDWIFDPGHRDEAIAIYRKHVPNASEVTASKALDAMLGDKEGLERKGRIDMPGVQTVLKLRSEFGRPRKELTDPSKYIDESYYRKALQAP